MTFRERRTEILSGSRMRTRMSGSMSGDWKPDHGASISTPPDEWGGNSEFAARIADNAPIVSVAGRRAGEPPLRLLAHLSGKA